MRVLAAALLAFLAVGIFPLGVRVLFTTPGLVFAAMSIALLVIAYRLVVARETVTTPAQADSPLAPSPKIDLREHHD